MWVGAHDEEKINSGVSLRSLKYMRYERDVIRESIGGKSGDELDEGVVMKCRMATELVELAPGEEASIRPK